MYQSQPMKQMPPFFNVVFTAPMVDSKARVAAALEISACFAMCSISSVLFTKSPCMNAEFVELSLQKIVLYLARAGDLAVDHYLASNWSGSIMGNRKMPWTITCHHAQSCQYAAQHFVIAEADSAAFACDSCQEVRKLIWYENYPPKLDTN